MISATLVLDHRLLPVREIMRLRADGEIYELRFVQKELERRPSASVPDTTFDPVNEHLHSSVIHQHNLPNAIGGDVQLAELQIAVLYRLNILGADTGEPIEVVRTANGHIRVSGTVVDDGFKKEIVSQLQMLPDQQFLDLKLVSPQDVKLQVPGTTRALAQHASVYDVNQTKSAADATLRQYFQAKGLSGEQLNSAVVQFSHDALQHAQVALQHVYALDRLGNALSAVELTSIDTSSQRQWTEMAAKHASELASELRALREQLAEVLGEQLSNTDGEGVLIENPVQFKEATDQLLHEMQNLNRGVGTAFASQASGESQPAPDAPLRRVINAIPLRQAEAIERFAAALNASAKAKSVDGHNSQDSPNDTSSRPQ